VNERDGFDQLLLDVLSEDAPHVAPDRLVPETQRALRDVRRRPRWLADLKEPPMRISSIVAAGSPTARLAAAVAATVLLLAVASGAVVAGASLLAGDGPLVVDQNDPSAYQTISDAVADAVDGDTVLVKPGTYPESVAISSDITVQGDGERGGVVVAFAADGPTNLQGGDPYAYGILLEDSDASVSNLTIQGPADDGTDPAVVGVLIVGGAPLVEGVDIVLAGDRWDYADGYWASRSAVRVTGGSSAIIRDSTWDAYVRIHGAPASTPTFEGNTMTGQELAVTGGGQQPIIRGNTFLEGADVRWDDTGSGGLVEDNDITGWIGVDEYNDPVLRGNRIHGGDPDPSGRYRGAAIGVASGATPTIEGNEIEGSTIGIIVTGFGADPQIQGNSIRGTSDTAIAVESGAAPAVDANTIEDNAIGISVEGSSTPTVTGNTFCGNEQDLAVPDGSELSLEGNTVCEA
jgi:parallel beta-helix repeat protein